MYLHNILKKPENELIRKVYEIQKSLPTKNDWYQMVQEDKNKLGLAVSDKQISAMSKENFKTIVKEAVRKFALNCLNKTATRKENSKSRKLVKGELERENYLVDKNFSKSECELLFALRTRMISGVKTNFSSQYENNLTCELCSRYSDQVFQDSQEHLLSCATLSKHVQIPSDIEYEYIW